MISRREFLQAAVAASAALAPASRSLGALAAGQSIRQSDLLDFADYGNVTLVHITDIHAQTRPVYFREPSINIGVGDANGLPPHITGRDFLTAFNLTPGSPAAYALASEDFVALATQYGRMGGLDRVATVINHIRASRDANMLLLDGGDTWQGSYVSHQTGGQDMVDIMNALKPDAMTAHWEFTFGEERVQEIVDSLPFAFLGSNIFDTEWDEPAFEHTVFHERGGVKIATIGQAFPYLPVANPHHLFPSYSFGIRESVLQANVNAARNAGAELVVLLSHNGFDVDRKLAGRVKGIDVILTGHTHDAIPEPVKVGNTLLIASGSNGKFVSRLDLDVSSSGVRGFRYRLIPVFADAIEPDADVAALIDNSRAPFRDTLGTVLGQTESLLYRRGNFNGSFDDLICEALLSEREADIALSPGFRWGPSLLPGQDITVEDLYNATAMSYPATYRTDMNGQLIKTILEDVADNLFNPDPYYQQGGDMVRVGGMRYRIDVSKPIGERISDMELVSTGKPIDPNAHYSVAGWASVNPDTDGPPIWDVVSDHLANVGTVQLDDTPLVSVTGT